MKKLISILLFSLFVVISMAQKVYRTQPLSDDIKTIQLIANGDLFSPPIIKIQSDESISIRFDKLSVEEPRLRYKIIHCNADWSASGISEIEYLDGFNNQLISDYRFSENTTVSYIHYQLDFPNNEIRFKVSGNYAVLVTDDSNSDNVLLTACFSVMEPKVQVRASVTGNTDIDINRAHQQVAFEINHASLLLRDPMNEIFVTVLQNNRLDNRRQNVKPSYVHPNRMVFEHNRELIFEGGNEYRRFETISRQYNGLNIYEIFYESPFMNALIYKDEFRSGKSRRYDEDQNGRFFIRNANGYDSDVDADYFLVHFTLDAPALVSDIFLNGDFTYNTFNSDYRMEYDSQTNQYHGVLLLKQGAYNYQYLSPSLQGFSTSEVEGNYYETRNEYLILVYYRAPGRRYDSLVGFLQAR